MKRLKSSRKTYWIVILLFTIVGPVLYVVLLLIEHATPAPLTQIDDTSGKNTIVIDTVPAKELTKNTTSSTNHPTLPPTLEPTYKPSKIPTNSPVTTLNPTTRAQGQNNRKNDANGDDEMLRIFQIGFNKAGTSSLAKFFERNQIDSIHFGYPFTETINNAMQINFGRLFSQLSNQDKLDALNFDSNTVISNDAMSHESDQSSNISIFSINQNRMNDGMIDWGLMKPQLLTVNLNDSGMIKPLQLSKIKEKSGNKEYFDEYGFRSKTSDLKPILPLQYYTYLSDFDIAPLQPLEKSDDMESYLLEKQSFYNYNLNKNSNGKHRKRKSGAGLGHHTNKQLHGKHLNEENSNLLLHYIVPSCFPIYDNKEGILYNKLNNVKWFEILDSQYSNAKFILNIRSFGHWLKSRILFQNGEYFEELLKKINKNVDCNNKRIASLIKNHGLADLQDIGYQMHFEKIDEIALVKYLKIQWYSYMCQVLQYFDAKYRNIDANINGIGKDLLIFDIENDEASKLTSFFDDTELQGWLQKAYWTQTHDTENNDDEKIIGSAWPEWVQFFITKHKEFEELHPFYNETKVLFERCLAKR